MARQKEQKRDNQTKICAREASVIATTLVPVINSAGRKLIGQEKRGKLFPKPAK
jgi:hypothetical protein